MDHILTIHFYVEDGEIKSRSDFALKYFGENEALAAKIAEELHYDFLHRMKEEGFVSYVFPNN